MKYPYIASVVRGMILGGLALGVAGTVALALFATIALTQAGWLVSVVPVVFIAFFTIITLALLQKDARRRKQDGAPRP